MEYPSLWDEPFEEATEDRIYEREMRAVRASDPPRIGEFTFDPRYPVHTCWDIGGDGTAIWFFQVQGNWITMIRYYEYAQNDILEGLAYCKTSVPWAMSVYGVHAGPHDIDDRSYLNYEENAIVVAARQGFDFLPTARPHRKENGIQAVRMIFPRLRFDKKNCALGIQRLEEYKWRRIQGQVTSHPVHNIASHCADALQTLALYIQEFSGPRYQQGDLKIRITNGYHATRFGA